MKSFLNLLPLSIILIGYACNSENGVNSNKIKDENKTLNRSIRGMGP